MAVSKGSSTELISDSLWPEVVSAVWKLSVGELAIRVFHHLLLPKSKESQVSEVSVWVTFVIIVEAESVLVLMFELGKDVPM